MNEWISPSVVALHGSLVEMALRLGRVEKKLGLDVEPQPLATFAPPGLCVPPPYEPCSCEEAMQLRAELAAVTGTLDTCRRERGEALDRIVLLEAKMMALEPIGV
jgi:hypothetical protein